MEEAYRLNKDGNLVNTSTEVFDFSGTMQCWVSVTFCLVQALVLTTEGIAPVSLKLFDDTNNKSLSVNFYHDDFLKFFLCMRAANSLECSADLTRDSKHPNVVNDLKVVSIIKQELLLTSRSYSNVFTCNCSAVEKKLTCTRLLTNTSYCHGNMHLEFFGIFNVSIESSKCAGILFHNVNESLLYESDGVYSCNISCNLSMENYFAKKPGLSSLQALSTTPTRVNNSTSDRMNISDNLSPQTKDKTHIIIAVVVSSVVTSGVIASACVFRRQILRMRRAPDSNVVYVSRNISIGNGVSKEADPQEAITTEHRQTPGSIENGLTIK